PDRCLITIHDKDPPNTPTDIPLFLRGSLLNPLPQSSHYRRRRRRDKPRHFPFSAAILVISNPNMVVRAFPYCRGAPQRPSNPRLLQGHAPIPTRTRYLRRSCTTRPEVRSIVSLDESDFRVFVVSDLHTDYKENMAWVECLSTNKHRNDVLIVAGDVAETYKNFYLTMALLKEKFEHVFFVPGNHDLWCRKEGEDYLDSLEKLNKLLGACRGLGVETQPLVINGLGIIPLFSWYHESFDKETDITGFRIPPLEMACKDYHACKWPEDLSIRDDSLSLHFDAMNKGNKERIKLIQSTCSQIITFSHFLPRQELCPEKRMLFYPNLPKVIGSDSLEQRIRSIHGTEGSECACHVFGHTHFCWDAMLDGIRYVQAPLAYPRERKRRMNRGDNWLPFCVYSDGEFSGKMAPCFWSDYYAANPRTPHDTQLAPWVSRFYKQSIR
ncbi:[Acyl-carrier-protein] phosphodiesterase PptH, partial [Linum perenne]